MAATKSRSSSPSAKPSDQKKKSLVSDQPVEIRGTTALISEAFDDYVLCGLESDFLQTLKDRGFTPLNELSPENLKTVGKKLGVEVEGDKSPEHYALRLLGSLIGK